MTFTTRLLLPLTATLLSMDSGAQSVGTGLIVGRITDERTCAQIPYANVILVGTTIGAMSDAQGKYQIWNVPPGKYDVRAMMLLYEAGVATVSIVPNTTIHADFNLNTIWVDSVAPKPSLPANVCSTHLEQMRWVLVSTYEKSLCAVAPGAEQPAPNDWPAIEGEDPFGGRFKVAWGPSCPRCVHISNENSSGGKWNGLPRSAGGGWRRYRIDGIVDFAAPKGLTDSVVVDACTKELKWMNKNLRIEVRRMPLWSVASYPFGTTRVSPRGDYRVFDVVGDCRSEIWVTQKNSTYGVIAFLESTTNVIDNMEISVRATGKDARRIVRTILGTMHFPEPAE